VSTSSDVRVSISENFNARRSREAADLGEPPDRAGTHTSSRASMNGAQLWMPLISVDDHLIEHAKTCSDALRVQEVVDVGPAIIDWKRRIPSDGGPSHP
jgi:hypothetical protein